jgi:hypothetical protein
VRTESTDPACLGRKILEQVRTTNDRDYLSVDRYLGYVCGWNNQSKQGQRAPFLRLSIGGHPAIEAPQGSPMNALLAPLRERSITKT